MNRYCYSACCSWNGPITEVGLTRPPRETVIVKMGDREVPLPRVGLPCCPFCGSMLFEVPTEQEWWEGAKEHEAKGHTNYLAFLHWHRQQKRCWRNVREAGLAYTEETGNVIKWDL